VPRLEAWRRMFFWEGGSCRDRNGKDKSRPVGAVTGESRPGFLGSRLSLSGKKVIPWPGLEPLEREGERRREGSRLGWIGIGENQEPHPGSGSVGWSRIDWKEWTRPSSTHVSCSTRPGPETLG
jgi:hypothetical protein